MSDRSTKRIQQVGWRLPADLYEDLCAYAKQTHRSAVAAAIVLLTKGLAAAAKKGEYVPPSNAPKKNLSDRPTMRQIGR